MGNIVVSLRTMFIVSGHRRLAALDALEESEDYGVEVNMVDLTPQEEAEQLLFFNNYHAQGQWDEPLLAEFVRENEVRLDSAGFDPFDLQAILDVAGVKADVTEIFKAETRPAEVVSLEAELAAIKPPPEVAREAREAAKAAAVQTPEGIQALKEAKREHIAAARERDNSELYLVLTMTSWDEKELVGAWLGLDPGERYVTVERLRARLVRAGVKELP